MKEKIIVLQRILPHYRIGFFKKLQKEFPETKIMYGQPAKKESLKNANFVSNLNFIFNHNFYFGSGGKIFLSNIYFKILKARPDIIITVFNVGNLNIYLLFLLKFIFRYKLILWSFGYDPVRGFMPQKSLADKIRLILSQKADAVIFYWQAGRNEVAEYSRKKDHYFIAPNTLDTDLLFKMRSTFDNKGKDQLKKELGIDAKFHFNYVGRLLEDKQVEILLRAFKIIEEKNCDVQLTIIGDGPESDRLKQISKDLHLKKVFFMGEILDQFETGKWIYVSDAFVMPGRLGLSVVHSFCFGTPVISQRKKDYFHGEGIGYIKENVNGFLTDDGNVYDLADKMMNLISDPTLSLSLRSNAIDTAKNDCSLSKMISGFHLAIKFVLSKDRR